MKRLIVALLFFTITVGFPILCLADHDDCQSSGLKSASAVIQDVADVRYCGMTVIPDGTNDCTVILYDNASTNSGTELDKIVAAGGSKDDKGHLPPFKITAFRGIYGYMTVTGGGTCGFIVWTKKD